MSPHLVLTIVTTAKQIVEAEIEATGQHTKALGYRERLEPLVQELAKRDFFTEKVDRRAGKGDSCYILGRCGATDPAKVCETLVSAGALAGLIVVDAKAALRNERSWQIDFKVPNLFESDDIENFVTTAFRDNVPGHAELERLGKFRDTLRAMGLPVRSIHCNPEFGGEVSYRVYFDNRQLNLGKRVVADMAAKALYEIGYGSEVDRLNRHISVSGHGEGRYIFARLKALKPQALKIMRVESDEEYMEFGEVAAARQGSIADELRLKRLVDYLKKLGFKIKEASMQQHSTHGGTFLNYLAVEYRLGFVWNPKLSLDDSIARQQIQAEVAHFLNLDRDFCGAKVTPQSNVRVEGGGLKWNLFTVTAMTESLRKPSGKPFERMDTSKLQLENDLSDYGAVAINSTPGLRTRLWLKKLRSSLEAKGLSVRNIHTVQWRYKMRIIAHIDAVGANQFDVNPKVFSSHEIITMWYKSVKETGSAVISDVGEETRIVADTERSPIVYSVKGFVQEIEGCGSWPEGSKLDEAMISLDDLNVEEHERLYGIAREAEDESRTNHAIKPVEVLWAHARPADKSINMKEGTIHVRMRFVATDRTDAIYAFNSGLSRTGSKRITGIKRPDGSFFPTLGIHKNFAIYGKHVIDMYAYIAPVGTPIDRPMTVRGPSSELWPQHVKVDDASEVSEAFDPEDEVWVRSVVSNTPGYRDLMRLKSAVRSIEEMGLKVTGVSQVPHNPHKPSRDTVCDVTISILKNPQETQLTQMYRIMPKVRTALEAYWEILDLRHEYDTTDGKHSVWLWKWHSHDAPQDIVPIHMRYGEWNDYAESGMADREMDSFLVEQFEEPGDDADPYLNIFYGAQDAADPIWRERLRLRAIADDMKAEGYGGSVRLTFSPATLHLYFTNPDQQKMDSYFTKDLLHRLNNKHHITSPGLIWANGHDLRRSYNNAQGQPESRCSLPYMFVNNDPKQVKPDQEPITVNVNEALEFTPTDMAGFGRVASRPDKIQVVRQAWKAFLKCFRDNFPGVGAYANYVQEPRPGNFSTFEFSVNFDDNDLYHIVQASYPEREKLQAMFREAVLAAGLKRYFPRRTIYFKWPQTQVLLDGTDHIIVICKFSLKGVVVPDKTEHISNVNQVAEAIDIDMDNFVSGALPGLEDQNRLKAMLDQWASLSRFVSGGAAWADASTERYRRGKYGADIRIQALSRWRDATQGPVEHYLSNYKGYVAQELLQLLANHGFGDFVFHGVGGHTMEINPLYLRQTGQNGWSISLRHATVSTPKFPKTDIKFGNTLGEALDFDPEAFGKEVIRDTDPAAEAIGRFQAAVRSLKRAHWDWIQDGTMRIGPGNLRGAIFAHTNYLFKPGQEKPKEFVTEVTRQALAAQGFQIVKIRPAAAEGGITILAAIQADAKFITTRFPTLFIDFDTVSLSEGTIDPDEFVTSSEEGTRYALYRNLKQIASSMASKGWIGVLQARNWLGSGTWHELHINCGKAQPEDVANTNAKDRVEADMWDAIKGFYVPHEPLNVTFRRNRLPGYTGEITGFWHWSGDVVIDLQGRANYPGNADAVTHVDIQTGAAQTYQGSKFMA